MSQYRINYILPNLAHHKDSLINDYFDTGVEHKKWFISKAIERKEKNKSYSNDEIFIKGIEETIKTLQETKETAKIEVINNDLKLSFDIIANSESFNIVNEEGLRPWLRQHLDDIFNSTMRTAILQKSFDWKNPGEKSETVNRFKEISKALDESLQGAFQLKTPTFWIDNEAVQEVSNKKKNKMK